MITIERATHADVPVLTEVQTRTFDDDSQRFLGKPSGGPPGYDSEQWQIDMMQQATAYYKIMVEGRIVGGMIVFAARQDMMILGRI